MKKLVAVLLAFVVLGGSGLAFAWWDNLRQEEADQGLDIGFGVRLEVADTNADTRALVPAGSFYAAYEADYTTEFVFTYELTLEEPLKAGMTAELDIDITKFTTYIVSIYNEDTEAFEDVEFSFNDSGVIKVAIDGATADGNVWTTNSNVFDDETNTVTITVRVTLEGHPNEDFVDHYAQVADLEVSFTIGFLLVNTGSSTLD